MKAVVGEAFAAAVGFIVECASLGCDSKADAYERSTRRGVDSSPAARVLQCVTDTGDDGRVAAEPTERHRREDETQGEHRGE